MTTNDIRLDVPAADALKYAAALLRSCTDWTSDAIGGSDCGHDAGHETELDAIDTAVRQIAALAGQYGDPRRYSDGRRVESWTAIAPGLTAHHVWHPDRAAESPDSWRSALPSDPDEPSPGIYEVNTDPTTQNLHVCVVRPM